MSASHVVRDGLRAAIPTMDLGIVGRRYPLVRALEPLPRAADHVAFGMVAALVLGHQR